MENRIKRKTLTQAEVEKEIAAIKQMKFDSVLLVTGEHETKVGMNYFRQMLPVIKQSFHYLAMEVQPLKQEEYAELKTLGLDRSNGVSGDVSSIDVCAASFTWQQDGF